MGQGSEEQHLYADRSRGLVVYFGHSDMDDRCVDSISSPYLSGKLEGHGEKIRQIGVSA